MRTIILETQNDSFAQALIAFLKSIDKKVTISEKTKTKKTTVKSIPISDIDPDAKPELLFGIWENRNISLEKLRNMAWGGRQ